MRKITTTLFLAAVLAAVSVSASPAAGVLDAVRDYRQALVKKDLAALEKIWTSDYVFVNGHGQLLTKADRIADIRSGHSSNESIRHEEEPTVKMHGNTALVLSRVTIVGKYSGREVSGQFRSVHVWLNENGHWHLAFNQLTPIDGK
jgi:ketosteroid isomerase-like protein